MTSASLICGAETLSVTVIAELISMFSALLNIFLLRNSAVELNELK